MNIETRQLKKGTVYKAVVMVSGKRKSKTFDSYREAARWWTAMTATMDRGKLPLALRDDQHTLGELIRQYIAIELPEKVKRSQATDLTRLDFWDQIAGHLQLSALRKSHVIEGRRMLKARKKQYSDKPLTNRTVNRYTSILAAVLNFGMRDLEWVDDNVAAKLRKLKEAPGRIRYLDDRERESLLAECKKSKSPLLYDFVTIALWTGGRRGEIWGLTPGAFRHRSKAVDFRHEPEKGRSIKTKKPRSVPLNDVAVAALERLCADKNENDLLFPSLKNPQKPMDFKKSFDAACCRAGVENFKLHDLRHTFASYLAMGGANAFTIMRLMGHESIVTSQRYVHLHQSAARDAVDQMAVVLGTLG